MTEIKDIATSMLELTDNIVRRKVKNSIIVGIYDKFVLPFFKRQIQNTPENEIRESLQLAYDNLRPLFEKKQIKDQIDEADNLTGFKLADKGLLQKESKYF